MLRHVLIYLVAFSWASSAFGDKLTEAVRSELLAMSGTISVTAQPQMAQGQLTGCILTFEAIQEDWVYLQGDFIRVSGSFGFMSAGENTAVAVKVVAVRITPMVPELGVTPLMPSRGYLIGEDYAPNFSTLISANRSDTAGGLFSIFQFSPSAEMILAALFSKKITVAIGLEGNSDIQLPIELDVVDVDADGSRIRSPRTALDFIDCTQRLLGG